MMKRSRLSNSTQHNLHRTAGLPLYILLVVCIMPQLAIAGKGYRLPGTGGVVQDYYDPIDRKYLDLVTGAHVIKMEQRYKKGDYVWVWSDIKYTLKHVPNHPQALQKLITFSREYSRISPTDADKLFEAAIKFTPDEPNTRILYGIHLHKYPRLDEAIEQYQFAVKLNPNSAEGHYNLGLALLEKNQIDEAKQHAQRAYEIGHPLPGLRDKLKKVGAWP